MTLSIYATFATFSKGFETSQPGVGVRCPRHNRERNRRPPWRTLCDRKPHFAPGKERVRRGECMIAGPLSVLSVLHTILSYCEALPLTSRRRPRPNAPKQRESIKGASILDRPRRRYISQPAFLCAQHGPDARRQRRLRIMPASLGPPGFREFRAPGSVRVDLWGHSYRDRN